MSIDRSLAAWVAAVAMLLLAVGAGFGDRRRRKRIDLDRIGLIDWPTVQFAALGAAFLFASIAFNV